MSRDLSAEDVNRAIEKGQPAPLYLFHGPNEFLIERVLGRLKHVLLPESARAFNMEVFYGGESKPADILGAARSMPFLSGRRLVVVRRTENFRAEELEQFLPYVENPVETTCLTFISAKGDFKKEFYRIFRAAGRAVACEELRDAEILPWLRKTAAELGFKIHPQAGLYLQQAVGNNLRDLYTELEKMRIRHGERSVGIEEVKGTVVQSRSFTIFELMTTFSRKDCGAALAVLNRFLEEEDKRAGPLRIIGMLNRQLRLLWETKAVLQKGGGKREVAEKLGPARFSASDFIAHAAQWSVEDLQKGLALLYQADGFIKSGSSGKLVLENLVFSLCASKGLG
ncbi:MAG: DNA polymerase III subunit delta [Deltaproteobacteria bacterium]|nr:DNA polymerase III subunit delta [Deltaproteobacteria bacterium]